MEGKNTLAAATLAATLTATSPTIAESSEAKALQEAITCETKLACQKLTESIQVQIDELENSDDPDFDKLDILQTQLIAVEKQETEQNSKLIATEKSETHDQNTLIDAIDKTDEKIAGLRGALLEN